MWLSPRRPTPGPFGLRISVLPPEAARWNRGVLRTDYRRSQDSLVGSFQLCHAGREMTESQSVAERPDGTGCWCWGWIRADRRDRWRWRGLRRCGKDSGETELAGRSYSATLVAAVGELLTVHKVKLGDLAAIVVVSGPGSFTGVRVGLSAVKGLAEPGQTPVVAVSRLAVLAAKAGVESAALDAHRHEVFLRLGSYGGSAGVAGGGGRAAPHIPGPKGEGPGAPT